MRCRQKTVGSAWHNLVTPQGDSVLFLCENCWSKTSPSERKGFLTVYLQATGNTDTPLGERLKSAVR
jgi:hypothetical protein